MSNSIFNSMNKQNGMSFPQFMQMMKGKDPNQILSQMVNSGQITQSQLNQAQQMAKNSMSQFDMFKSMFGF